MIKFLKSANKLFAVSLFPFVLDKESQNKILSQFPEPKDLMERSYFQYRCQSQVLPVYKRILNNAISIFPFLYFLLLGVMGRNRGVNKKGSIKLEQKPLAIFPYKDYLYPNVLPSELIEEFNIHKINFMSGFSMNWSDVKFIAKISIRYPFQFYFLTKCVSKILFYRYILKNFQPATIISCSEYSFNSSVLTQYCRENHVEHINVMHGEKFFLIKDSFFEFDRFYVWDAFYKNLFISLRATSDQFILGSFSHLKMNLTPGAEIYSYTYYLANEAPERLVKIKEALSQLDAAEHICIRFHPRYSPEHLVKKIFTGFSLENPKQISLEESFSRTKNVISLYSSCLIQAHFNGKNIIIDDVTQEKRKLDILEDSDYIIFSKPHQLLSHILKNTTNYVA